MRRHGLFLLGAVVLHDAAHVVRLAEDGLGRLARRQARQLGAVRPEAPELSELEQPSPTRRLLRHFEQAFVPIRSRALLQVGGARLRRERWLGRLGGLQAPELQQQVDVLRLVVRAARPVGPPLRLLRRGAAQPRPLLAARKVSSSL
jgi:hypothetical protein